MYESIKGTVVDLQPAAVVLETAGGVGYLINISLNTYASLQGRSEARLLVHLVVREDAWTLFGFADERERSLFRLLISVSGVGPKAGMSILSLLTPKKLALVIAAEDTKAISKAPGVGAKTAARVVLELKEKVAKNFPQYNGDNIAEPAATAGKPVKSSSLTDARDALVVLGYSRSEVAAALKNVDAAKSTEDIIKQALAVLMKN